MKAPITNLSSLVIGTIGFDSIETPEGLYEKLLGGSAWYAAIAASFFSKVEMVAAVGCDFDEGYRNVLLNRGIGLDGLFVNPAKPTFAWGARYGEGFATRETTKLELNALEDFHPQIPEAGRASSVAMLCNFDPRLQEAALAQLSPDCYVILDTIDFWICNERERVDALLPRCGLLLANEEETALWTGLDDCESAGRKLIDAGASAVVVKRGGAGSVLIHPDGVFEMPICRAAVLRDPTGAGDTFGGAILGYLASQETINFESIKEAMAWGAALASFTVEDFSSDRLLAVTLAELQDRYGQLGL